MRTQPSRPRRRRIILRYALQALAIIAMVLPGEAALAEDPVASIMPGKPDFYTGAYDLHAQGYAIREFSVAGKAVSYRRGWRENSPIRSANARPYKIRVVVLTPLDPAKFNGTVVVEWLNVSSGADIGVDWILLHRELIRRGYAYIGVSAQAEGIDGTAFPVPGVPLKKADPARYDGLSHPGDAYSYDIFSDTGRLLKQAPGALLGSLRPRRILAMGESQSALYLVTYVNDIDPLARVYDGFLIHSRSGNAAGLDGTSIFLSSARQMRMAVRLGYPRVPVLQLIAETELTQLGGFVGFYAARQPDNGHLRTWEVAGASHGDNYLLGSAGAIDVPLLPIGDLAAAWAPTRMMGADQLPVPMNNGPQFHYVGEAALACLNGWVAGGRPPPSAPPVELIAGDPPSPKLDANGNALGGIRTPWMDVPISRLSGVGGLTGSTAVFDAEMLDRLYPTGRDQYMREFDTALDRTIASGFILPADRKEILELAKSSFPEQHVK